MYSLPLTIVAGYLGSGKTTYINQRLQQANGVRYAVLVNDFGELNIDVDLIRHTGKSVATRSIELNNGCICCSIANNIDEVLAELRTVSYCIDWIILEASGVADPERVKDKVLNWPGFRLENTITLVDVTRIRRLVSDKYVGLHIKRQLKLAEQVLLTKTDLVSRRELKEIEAWLESYLNSGIEPDLVSHHPEFFSSTMQTKKPIARSQFVTWLDKPDPGYMRIKGFVYLEDEPEYRYLLQWVDGYWTLDRFDLWTGQPETRLLIISAEDMLTSLEYCLPMSEIEIV